jgi:hypothetical protein
MAQVPQLRYLSLHQTAQISHSIAQKFMIDPQLFAFAIDLDKEALFQRMFFYASPLNSRHFLNVSWDRDGNSPSGESVNLGLAHFAPNESCMHFFPGWRHQSDKPQSESKHPRLRGWKLELPDIWRIVKKHKILFVNTAPRVLINTAAWLKEADRQRESACDWFAYKTARGTTQRLADEPGGHAVVEIDTPGDPTFETGGKDCFGTRSKSDYLIVDAATGIDLEEGTYIRCFADRE